MPNGAPVEYGSAPSCSPAGGVTRVRTKRPASSYSANTPVKALET